MIKYYLITEKNIFPVHLVKPYRASRGTDPLVLSLGSSWRQVANITPRPLYPQEGNPVHTILEAGWDLELFWRFWRGEILLIASNNWKEFGQKWSWPNIGMYKSPDAR